MIDVINPATEEVFLTAGADVHAGGVENAE